MSTRLIYPDWCDYSSAAHKLAATLGRIADRVDQWKLLEVEKNKALEWCRNNGNPHLKKVNICRMK